MDVRVVVVGDHPVTRWGLCRLIDAQDGLVVTAEAATAEEALRLTASLVPDVVVVGLHSPAGFGLPLATHLRDRFDDLGIVVLAATDDDDVLLQAFETGVSAFVSERAPVTEVVAAVRHAAVAASSFTAAGLAAALRRQREAGTRGLELSAREREVLDLLVAGRSVPWIAEDLHISISTAKTYVGRLYDKLGVRSRAEAVLAAVRLGLVAPARTAAPASGRQRVTGVVPVQRHGSADVLAVHGRR
jgi:DNA-binding NarL/FixJ family response regulator